MLRSVGPLINFENIIRNKIKIYKLMIWTDPQSINIIDHELIFDNYSELKNVIIKSLNAHNNVRESQIYIYITYNNI